MRLAPVPDERPPDRANMLRVDTQALAADMPEPQPRRRQLAPSYRPPDDMSPESPPGGPQLPVPVPGRRPEPHPTTTADRHPSEEPILKAVRKHLEILRPASGLL